jgi:putative ABC transport system permease protein
MVTSISSAIDVHASNAIYKNLISTFNLAESSIMSIVIPMTIVIVSIISNLIIDDSKKLAAMLKTLGYSDGKNTASIFALFIPAIFIGLIVAIPLTKFIITAYQSIIFNSANILVNVKYT